MFQRYVTSVSYGCYKSRSRCCTCCNGCTRMLQALVLNVSSVFSDVCCKFIYLDVAYVFTHMIQVFYLKVVYVYNGFKCFQVFLQVFQTHVSNVSFIFRNMLQLLPLDVLKLDRVLHFPPCLQLSCLGVRHGKWAQAESVPTSTGGPHMRAGGRNRRDVGESHVLVGGRSWRDVGRQARDRRGQQRGRPDEGLASGRPGARHALYFSVVLNKLLKFWLNYEKINK